MIILFVVGWLTCVIFDDNNFSKFKEQHHCVKTKIIDSSTGISTNGSVVFIRGSTCYKCDDGIEYCRES